MILLAGILLAGVTVAEGADYRSEDLEAPAPGPRWRLQTVIPDAPSLRGAYVLPREGGAPSSLITFALDGDPQAKVEPYVQAALKELEAPPLSFQVRKTGALQIAGAPAFRADYTDKDGLRQFCQVARETGSGGIVVMVLQSPDAKTFGEDLPVFLSFAEKVTAKTGGGTSSPAPSKKPPKPAKPSK